MASSEVTIEVDVRQLVRACDQTSAEVGEFFRDGLVKIGEPMARDIAGLYAAKSAKGAAGVRAKVTRPGNAIVAQTVRKGRGLRQRKNFGPMMFSRAFLPGLEKNEPTAQAALEDLVSKVNDEYWSD